MGKGVARDRREEGCTENHNDLDAHLSRATVYHLQPLECCICYLWPAP